MKKRLDGLNSYENQFKNNLQLFIKMLNHSNGSIFLVTVDANVIRDSVLNMMPLFDSKFKKITNLDIRNIGCLSAWIYSHIDNNQDGTLILDFSDLFVANALLTEYELHLLEEINANRDIFIKHFKNTVLMFSSSMSFWFQSMARDICSCISFHFDTRNWFIIPEDVPIFHINFPIYHSYSTLGSSAYKKYVIIRNQVNSLTNYNHTVAEELLSQIRYLYGDYKSELMCLLLKKICSIPAPYELSFFRKNAIKYWPFSEIGTDIFKAQAYCYAGEFWHMNSKFQDAFLCFKKSLQIINSTFYLDERIDRYANFIVCNIMLCNYQTLTGRTGNLLKLVTKQLDDVIKKNNDEILKMYAQSYLFVYKVCLGNCNYATLLDLYEQEDNQTRDYSNLNIYKNISFWVHYIVTENLTVPNNLDLSNPWTCLHILIASMVNSFKKGNYDESEQLYNEAREKSIELGHTQLRNILISIKKNMLFLRSFMQSTNSIAALEKFIQNDKT